MEEFDDIKLIDEINETAIVIDAQFLLKSYREITEQNLQFTPINIVDLGDNVFLIDTFDMKVRFKVREKETLDNIHYVIAHEAKRNSHLN